MFLKQFALISNSLGENTYNKAFANYEPLKNDTVEYPYCTGKGNLWCHIYNYEMHNFEITLATLTLQQHSLTGDH